MAIALSVVSSLACALQTDRQQPMNIDARYQKSTQSLTGNPDDLDITNLDGNVVITQGSLKSTGDHAVIYKNPTGVADESGDIGGIRRIVLTGKGKLAHLEQVHDIDCSLMTADAQNIDYNNVTGIAVLTRNVTVVQHGKSEFHGEHMVYNTATGEMEGRRPVRREPRAHGHPAQHQGGRRADHQQLRIPRHAETEVRQIGDQEIMLRATGLQKSFRGRTVVRDFDFQLAQGEVVGLLGPNGAGKTTTFYMVVGLIGADAGRIMLDKHDITQMPMHVRAKLGVGYLPQEPSVFRRLSVAENVLAILELRDDLDASGRRKELESLLEELQISHIADSKGLSLSGGERRRVEITRALAARPRFMLLDEPFAGIDPISVVEIQRIVRQLKARGIGILITDHNVRETLGICDHAYIMSDGAVLAKGPPATVLANEQVREVYLGKEFRM